MTSQFTGKCAIVTGSSRGMGAGFAIELAKRGAAAVVVNYVSPNSLEKAEAVKAQIEAHGAKAVIVQANMAVVADMDKIVTAAREISPSGGIDIIIHNAANGEIRKLEDVDEEFYYKQTDINIKGVIFLQKACLPYLNKESRIVIMGSTSGRGGYAEETVYGMTKAALQGLARVWATELGRKYECTVNLVNPGPVSTDMWWQYDESYLNAVHHSIENCPVAPRIAEVSDIVPLVMFLCSKESGWSTGSTLNANGGAIFV